MLWIGANSELHINKGLETLLFAFAQIQNPNVVCVIIGPGEEKEKLFRKEDVYIDPH